MKSKVRSFTKLRAKSRALEAARAAHQRLIAELQRTQAELARALTLRDEFMVMVTHELRTPLGVMALEVMLRQQRLAKGDLAWFSPERLQSMLDKDGRQVRSMTRLIEDMLDVSRLQHGMLSIRRCRTDLAELARHVVADFEDQYRQVPLSLIARPGIVGDWDDSRIAQVLVNLLSNALRYGGGAAVQVEVDLTDDGLARLAVTDQGPGIQAEDQQRIFQPFERLPGTSKAPGLGMGLYISQQLVQAHGGRIVLHSEPSKGASFEVLLPLTPTTLG